MARIIKLKNVQDSADTYCGQQIQSGSYYQLKETEFVKFATDQKVQNHMSASPSMLVVNNGTSDLEYLAGKNWLEGTVPVDSDGVPLTSSKTADLDGRSVVHATPRVLGTYTYFTGSDDDHTDATKVGGASNVTDLCGHHEVGDDATEVMYFDLNTIINSTYIHEGVLQWKDALNDTISLDVVPKTTTYTSGTSTNFNLYGGYLIVPAAGNGTIAVETSNMKLVQCVVNEYGTKSAGYWDATFNTSSKQFENITAAPYGDGDYNLFGAEVQLARFGNRLRLLGNGAILISSEDSTQIGHGMRIKVIAGTVGTDHEWWWNFTPSLYRKKTC